jgi:hypothetical protein
VVAADAGLVVGELRERLAGIMRRLVFWILSRASKSLPRRRRSSVSLKRMLMSTALYILAREGGGGVGLLDDGAVDGLDGLGFLRRGGRGLGDLLRRRAALRGSALLGEES